MNMAIEIKGLNKEYPNFALRDVSFSLPRGSIMGFIGPNGAGKTTTIRAILGLTTCESGEISVLGGSNQDIAIKHRIGVVFDESNFYNNLRVGAVGKVEKALHPKWDTALWQDYIQRFKLPLDKDIKDFSRGMRMKLAIAVALSRRPELLILDEATSGLDPVVREEILDIFLDFIQDENHAILLSSHITSDLDKVADYITFIHEGQIVFSADKNELLTTLGVARCGAADFAQIPDGQLIRYRQNDYGYEVLIQDRAHLQAALPGLTIDPATSEEIMLFYVHGKRRA